MKVEVEQEKRWKGEGMCGFASGAILCEVFMLNMSSVDYYFVSFFSLLVSDWLVSNEYVCQHRLFLHLSSAHFRLCSNSSTIVKAEGCRVIHKEVDKTVNDNVAWPCREVIEVTLHDNMFVSLHFGLSTRAHKGRVREEPLAVFPNGGMSCGHTGELGTQSIGEPYEGELWAIFSIGRFNDMLFLVLKVQEELFFLLIGWEWCLLFLKDIVVFFLFMEQKGVSARESWHVVGHFDLVVDKFMFGPLSFTCYDLAKWLSYYLYFFSFLFLLDLLYKEEVQESVT